MKTNSEVLLKPEEIKPATDLINKAIEQLDKILLGRTELHKMVMAGILSRGHILLEGLPGLGKTALVRALGLIFQLDFKRIQFTPDLMPADIVGAHILQEGADGKRTMTFEPGPVFTNILLADEINRASPKTQSAMLETMQEHSVTLMGVTRKLPEPFFVLASQNPIELEGTYPLPEAQIDRFLFRLMVTDVDENTLTNIIGTRRRGEPPSPDWHMSKDDFKTVFDVMDRIYLPKQAGKYIARLVKNTHSDAPGTVDKVRSYVTYGASPRAAIAIAESARAIALMDGRPTVGFEDIRRVATHVLNHRVILNYKARFDKVTPHMVLQDLLKDLSETDIDLPKEVEITA